MAQWIKHVNNQDSTQRALCCKFFESKTWRVELKGNNLKGDIWKWHGT